MIEWEGGGRATQTDTCSQHTRAGRRGGHEQRRARSPSVTSGLPYTHFPGTAPGPGATILPKPPDGSATAVSSPDNGRIYTARFGGGRNAFEYLLPLLGVKQKNGSPGHPQTQGKIERFHQTQKRRLAAQPAASALDELQRQLDAFLDFYNEHRPHRALDRRTPGHAYRATPKALPADGHAPGYHRLRYDRLDAKGRMTLRRAGKMHHLGIGAAHARKRVLALADDHHVTVCDLATGEVLSTHLIQPDNTYWRNQNKPPGRWPTAST